jgi:putative endonuclease
MTLACRVGRDFFIYIFKLMETSDVSRYYIYILFSLKDKGLYIGFTENLKRRLTEHSKSQVTSTKLRVPFKLIRYEYFINKTDAKAREEFLKSGHGRKQLKEILKRTLKNI